MNVVWLCEADDCLRSSCERLQDQPANRMRERSEDIVNISRRLRWHANNLLLGRHIFYRTVE